MNTHHTHATVNTTTRITTSIQPHQHPAVYHLDASERVVVDDPLVAHVTEDCAGRECHRQRVAGLAVVLQRVLAIRLPPTATVATRQTRHGVFSSATSRRCTPRTTQADGRPVGVINRGRKKCTILGREARV